MRADRASCMFPYLQAVQDMRVTYDQLTTELLQTTQAQSVQLNKCQTDYKEAKQVRPIRKLLSCEIACKSILSAVYSCGKIRRKHAVF